MNPKTLWLLLRDAVQRYFNDKAPRLAAALAFYTAFSLAPLLVIAVAFAGFFVDEVLVERQVAAQLQSLVGPAAAQFIAEVMESAAASRGNVLATLIGLGVLLFAATGVLHQLQMSLNTIWGVAPKPELNLMALTRARLLSFAMILIIGFLLLVSLLISAVLAVLDEYLRAIVPGAPLLWRLLNLSISFGFTTLLFAMIFKFLPDAHVKWRDVWVGAGVTALLFSIGKYVIGLYLGNSGISLIYGAAGSFAVLLLWVYFSAQIVLFGAELTQLYANRYGSHIVPSELAVPITQATRAAAEARRERAERG